MFQVSVLSLSMLLSLPTFIHNDLYFLLLTLKQHAWYLWVWKLGILFKVTPLIVQYKSTVKNFKSVKCKKSLMLITITDYSLVVQQLKMEKTNKTIVSRAAKLQQKKWILFKSTFQNMYFLNFIEVTEWNQYFYQDIFYPYSCLSKECEYFCHLFLTDVLKLNLNK